MVAFVLRVFHHNVKEESLCIGVLAMRDVGLRNGPAVPVQSLASGVRALDRVVRKRGA